MALETKPWDAADYLKTPEDERLYLEAACEDGEPNLIVAAIGDIARARGMTKTAQDTGLTRDALYKAFSPEGSGNPTLQTLTRVLKALGYRISIQAA